MANVPFIHQGFLNQNAGRAYPLSEEATRRDTSGSYTLPDDFIVDMIVPINAVLNYSLGNINLLGDDCLEITPVADEYAVQLADKCSKPCCGCDELETLVTDQRRVRDQVQTMENLIARLESNMSVLSTLLTAIRPC